MYEVTLLAATSPDGACSALMQPQCCIVQEVTVYEVSWVQTSTPSAYGHSLCKCAWLHSIVILWYNADRAAAFATLLQSTIPHVRGLTSFPLAYANICRCRGGPDFTMHCMKVLHMMLLQYNTLLHYDTLANTTGLPSECC